MTIGGGIAGFAVAGLLELADAIGAAAGTLAEDQTKVKFMYDGGITDGSGGQLRIGDAYDFFSTEVEAGTGPVHVHWFNR